MFTYDGLKKVSCYIEDGKVVINGGHYGIFSCNDITSSAAGSIYAMAIILLVTLLVESFICCQTFKSGNYNEFIALITLTCAVTALLLWAFISNYNLRKQCRTIWRVNYNYYIYIEHSDEVDAESKLISTLNALKPKGKVNYKIIAILVISPFLLTGIAVSTVFLAEGTRYAKPALILFLIFVGSAGVYNIYAYYQRLKWKGQT